MKEKYSRPQITNSNLEVNHVEVLPAAAALAGAYALGRAITKAVKASPSIKLPALPRSKS